MYGSLSRPDNEEVPAMFRNVPAGTLTHARNLTHVNQEFVMRSIVLWAIGVPIPLILLLALCTHHL
jgi:hypothetical protein